MAKRNPFKQRVVNNTMLRLLEETGNTGSNKLIDLALKKAEVWMRNAYGGNDWENYLNECIDVVAFYNECLSVSNDRNSFNRQSARNRG